MSSEIYLSIDEVLDFADTAIDTPARARKRDRDMAATLGADKTPCEICGRALDEAKATKVMNTRDGSTIYLGPTCTKKARKAGLLPQ